MATKKYDVVVIGAGQAGIPLAQALAKAGRKVALAEMKHLGGSCVNYGCTPTKAVVASARVAHLARRARDFGLEVDAVRVDFPKVLARARAIVADSRSSLAKMVSSSRGIELLEGEARLQGRSKKGFRLAIAGEDVEAAEVVLNTGTHTRLPPVDGLDSIPYITSETWLEHEDLPSHLLMIGGGYIGLEMGQFYRRMGSEVTIVNAGAHVAGHEDHDVSDALQELLEAEGIRFVMDAKVAKLEKRGSKVAAHIQAGKERSTLEASHVFVATGRQPNTGELGLDLVGLAVEKDGTVKTDKRLATKVDGLWVAGDIRGGPMFTHTSWDDYRILESQMLGNGERTLERVVPYAVFTDPELGRVGMTETEARDKGRKVRIGRFEMRHDGKAREIGETAGFIKVVVDAETGLILGASVLAVEGAELVHSYIQLMNAEVPFTVMENAIHIHPTLSEAVQSAVSAIDWD
ncbi:MAG: mercuric reductase [Pseudomonadota bacterium]|nr:mercuric reductase [Pseudomonadota bacterium]